MKRLAFTCALSYFAFAIVSHAQNGRPATPASGHPYVPVTDEMLWKPDPANWLSWRRTLDGWGYSPLDQIDRNNVARLKMAWTRGLGMGTVEATPLVYDGVMYVPGPGDVIAAINAKTGDLMWEHRRKLPECVFQLTASSTCRWRPVHRAWRTRPCVSRRSSSRA